MGRSRMSVIKRQRELKKAEKAAQKRAKRHGAPQTVFTEPRPTVRLTEEGLVTDADGESKDEDEDEGVEEDAETEA